MFIVYEYATYVLVASIGATLLFTACLMSLVVIEGSRILAQRSRQLTHSATQLKGSWMAAESRDS